MGKLKVDLKCDIEEIYGFLNPEHTMIYCRVSWNGRKAKDEIRKCTVEDDGEIHLSKGLAITGKEVETLIKIYNGELVYDGTDTGVNFEQLFSASEGIMEKREAGYKTKDGFIVVERKHKG